jgi:hypothetical protein
MNTNGAEQLSGDARRVLSRLPKSGRACYLRPFADRLSMPLEKLRAVGNDLASQGLVRIEGNRIRRIQAQARKGTGLSPPANKLLRAIPSDGSALSNLWLRSRVDLTDNQYTAAKQELQGDDWGIHELREPEPGLLSPGTSMTCSETSGPITMSECSTSPLSGHNSRAPLATDE